MLVGLFWNHQERRLRCFWRLLLTIALYIALQLGVVALLLFTGRGSTLTLTVFAVLSLFVIVTSVALAPATLLTSAVFGVAHAPNPNATALSVGKTISAGIVFTALYVFSGQLAIPIGFHASWNIFQSAIFGFPMSGAVMEPSVLRIRQSGPEFVTGGDYGPEGGWLTSLALFSSLLLALMWIRLRQGRFALRLRIVAQ